MKTACTFLFLTALLLNSCVTNDLPEGSLAPVNSGSKIIPDALRKNVLLTCSATSWGTETKWVNVSATLHNYNNDTVYFLTTTCLGDQYWLQYDTSKLRLNPQIMCNASYPMLAKIAPGANYHFTTQFVSLMQTDSLDLGFHLCVADKNMDLKPLNVSSCHQLIRQEQNLLRAPAILVKKAATLH